MRWNTRNDHEKSFGKQHISSNSKGTKPWISLPKGNGIKLNIIEDRNARMTKGKK